MVKMSAAGTPGTLSLKGLSATTAVERVLQAEHAFQYDFAVFIGRMRPPTNAHLANIRHALTVGRWVIVIVGSALAARSPRSPFTEAEVEVMLRGNFSAEENERLIVVGQRDMYNNTLWLTGVRALVAEAAAVRPLPGGRKPRIALVGHFKDARTSDYLKRFRGWDIEATPNFGGLSATPIRDDYWVDPEAAVARHASGLPANVVQFLLDFAKTPDYAWLVGEDRFYAKEREIYANLPHPPTWHTADPVVVMDDCVLLVERDISPGLGLLSLPGGYVGASESIADAALRSLFEKTKMKLTPRIVASRITASEMFDYPYRSERGRLISTGYLIELQEDSLPKVAAGKNVRRSVWMPIEEIDPRRMFEDHMRIIEVMVARIKRS